MAFIDLSVVLNERTPVYPGDPELQIIATGVYDRDGYNDHTISLGTHVGTHIDAPFHMLKNGRTLATYPIERFFGRGRYIKVNGQFILDDIKAANLQSGDIVLFDTGMSADYYKARYFTDYPVMSQVIAEYLINQGVSMVGFDACSPDNQADFPIHKTLLTRDVLIIENLTNLAEVKGNDCTVFALPLRFELDASPARVIAVLP